MSEQVQPSQSTPRTQRGFTLVELLVVIGIIALMISILIPSLNQARKQAQLIKCQSNLRQMGLAMSMYVNEWKFYPGRDNEATRGGSDVFYAVWPTRLRRYMNNAQGAFTCPSQQAEYDWKQNATTPPVAIDSDSGYGYKTGEALLLENRAGLMDDINALKFSYGYNDWGAYDEVNNIGITNTLGRQRGLGGDVWKPKYGQLKASLVCNPTVMINIADSTVDGVFDYNLDPRSPAEAPGKIHKGGANVLYGDGHVEWHLQKELVLYNVNNTNIKYAQGAVI